MYRVVIIDDEQIVREGIYTLIDWQSTGFVIVGDAADGEEGLDCVLRYKPDVALVDIRMPGISGIELIRQARAKGYEGVFLILSGYSEFTYAKSAISLGVKEYLVKPIDEDELCHCMKEIKIELDNKRKKESNRQILQDEQVMLNEKMQQNITYNILMKPEMMETTISEIKRYHLDYNYNEFHVIILSNMHFYLDVEYESKLEYMMTGIAKCEYLKLSDSMVFITKGDQHEKIVNLLKKNNQWMKDHYGKKFFISMGQSVKNVSDIRFSFECAKWLQDFKFLFGEMGYISIDILKQQTNRRLHYDKQQLSDCIEIGDIDGIKRMIHALLEDCRYRLMKEPMIKVMVVNAIALISRKLEERYIDVDGVFMDVHSLSEEVNHTKTIEQLETLIVGYCMTMSRHLGNTGQESVIKRMNAYVSNNYNKDLKLESIAKLFGYNSAYLGQVYKKTVGESFNNTLDRVRIEHAMKLLQTTNLKVYQVSEKIGYSNIDYFYMKFKKYVGVTPKEFKGGI